MPFQDEFYAPPGQQLEPGDVFLRAPFPLLKYPLTYWRMRANDPQTASLHGLDHGSPQPGTDSPKSSIELRKVMLVSHGCEVDRIHKLNEPTNKRYWLVAPVLPLANSGPKTQQRTRERNNPSKFYLPPSEYSADQELYVDLRRITPVNCQYLLDSVRLHALTPSAQKALFAHWGLLFRVRTVLKSD